MRRQISESPNCSLQNSPSVTRSCRPLFLVPFTSIFFPLMRSSQVCVSNSMVSISMVRRIFTFCAVDEPVDDVCCTLLRGLQIIIARVPQRETDNG